MTARDNSPKLPVRPANLVAEQVTMSEQALHVLKDMVELQMYLVAQARERPLPMLPRCTKRNPETRQPFCNPVDYSAVIELLKLSLIEYSSQLTLVVSAPGILFYERKFNPQSDQCRHAAILG
jgi:hypothetical protein